MCTPVFEFFKLPKRIVYCIYVVIAFANPISLCNLAIAQTNVTQITKSEINTYRKVTSINKTNKTVTFSGTSMFVPGELPDTVLLIQMTGVTTNGVITGTGAGFYEFHIVESVTGSGNSFTVTLKSTPGDFNANNGSFTPSTESVQIIRIPSYKNAEIPQTNTLKCGLWDWATGTGGVLALMVDETLTLKGNIDVSGLGFNGGKEFGRNYTKPCSFNATDETDKPDYPGNSDLAGYKGEGAVTKGYLDAYPKGYGKAWNGGGGGNGKWSGGGGGANGANGGNGDYQACTVTGNPVAGYFGGNKGLVFPYDEINPSERVFMGGGGGAGTGNGTKGGNGGGIVIIVAQTIAFAPNTAIKANGGSVTESRSDAGAGGGGAGGSILLSAVVYDNLVVEIAGGDGGSVNRGSFCDNVNNSMGAGGGGSGGLLLTTNDNTWFANNQTKIKRNNGEAGKIATSAGGSCQGYATPGAAGIYRGNFQVQMRGFLRNYIIPYSIQACPAQQVTIEASSPQGGTTPYNYLWQTSPTGTGSWTDIPNSNIQNLKHSFTGDTWVRRRVTSSGITDNSSPIKVTVGLAINNTINPHATTLCWVADQFEITGDTPTTGGGGGPYKIQWQQSTNNRWENMPGETGDNLKVPLLAGGGTQKYLRRVTSDKGCVSKDSSVITVQPVITGNTITPGDQKICEDHAQKLTGPATTGGAGTANNFYRWQVKTEGLNWTELTNDQTSVEYLPKLETSQLNNINPYLERYYRRDVTSGECHSEGNEVTVRFYEQPSDSNIETTDKVLEYTFREELVATAPEPAGIASGKWSSTDERLGFNPPDKSMTTVSNLQFGVNIIRWTVSNGACVSASDSILIEVKDVNIPNGFSPNGDGINDCFKVAGGENATSGEIIVLDRYNNVVFESKSFKGNNSNNPNDCSGWWDGRSSSGKELPPGTYFYQLTLNGEKVYKGYVVLKKQ